MDARERLGVRGALSCVVNEKDRRQGAWGTTFEMHETIVQQSTASWNVMHMPISSSGGVHSLIDIEM